MAFLTDADYDDAIKPEILAKITENSIQKRTNMEQKVQEEISMTLRIRYNVPEIFNKAGASRNAYLVTMMVDMVIYRLAKRLNPGQITETIKDGYINAKQDLDKIASGNFQIDLPLVGDADGNGVDDKEVIQWGSNPKRSHISDL